MAARLISELQNANIEPNEEAQELIEILKDFIKEMGHVLLNA